MGFLDEGCENMDKGRLKESILRFLEGYEYYDLQKNEETGMFYGVRGQPSIGRPVGMNEIPKTIEFKESEIEKLSKRLKRDNPFFPPESENDEVNSYILVSRDPFVKGSLQRNIPKNGSVQFCKIPQKYIDCAEKNYFEKLEKYLG